MKKGTAWLLLCDILLILPRSSLAYLFYFVGSLLLFKISLRLLILSSVLFLCTLLVFFINSQLGYRVSPTAWLLAFVMHLPFLLMIFGCQLDVGRISPLSFMRLLNVTVFILSIFSMSVNKGFPFRLPYLHYLPDEYFALFGLGGAKIITVIGFFGLAAELFDSKNTGKLSKSYALIASSNFVVPSYLIGTVCGIMALVIPNLKKPKFQIMAGVIGLLVLDFILGRIDTINSDLQSTFGFHPKILAYIAVAKLYLVDPVSFFLGTGIGQFASASAEWGSEYLAVVGRSIELPGLYMSYFHDQYLGAYLAESARSKWIISSSMNKPYTSISVLFAEFGFIAAVLFLFLLIRTVLRNFNDRSEALTILCFVFALFSLDVWHDNFWFSGCLLIYLAMARSRSACVAFVGPPAPLVKSLKSS